MITHSHPPDRVGVRWLLPSLKVYHIPFPTIASSATLPNFLTFLPYLRTIVLRENIQLIHAHASLSSFAHEGILHAHLMGVRTVFTDHSLFGFDDAASILTNKLLEAALRNVDAVICVSNTGCVSTSCPVALSHSFIAVERTQSCVPAFTQRQPMLYPTPSLQTSSGLRWRPQHRIRVSNLSASPPLPSSPDIVTIVVISRLAYRKGVDLLVATAPRICAKFPEVNFVIGVWA